MNKMIYGLIFLLCVGMVSALQVSDVQVTQDTMNSNAPSVARWGMKFLMSNNVGTFALTNAEFLSDCSMAYLEDSSHNILASAPITNYNASFNYILIYGREYYITCDNSGSSYTVTYEGVGGFPHPRTMITWTASFDSDVGDDTTYWRNVKSVTLRVSTPDGLVSNPMADSLIYSMALDNDDFTNIVSGESGINTGTDSVVGVFDDARLFDSVSEDYITYTMDSRLSGNPDFTLNLWFYLDSTPHQSCASFDPLIGWGTEGTNQMFGLLLMRTDSFTCEGSISETRIGLDYYGNGMISPNGMYNFDEWTMLTVKKVSDNHMIYVDGVNVVNLTVSGTNFVANTLQLGHRPNIAQGFSGRIDDVNIFDRALSDSEILSLLTTPYPFVSCTPDWSCTGYASCVSPALNVSCNAVSDLNTCGQVYGGDFSEFAVQECSYPVQESRGVAVAGVSDKGSKEIPVITADVVAPVSAPDGGFFAGIWAWIVGLFS